MTTKHDAPKVDTIESYNEETEDILKEIRTLELTTTEEETRQSFHDKNSKEVLSTIEEHGWLDSDSWSDDAITKKPELVIIEGGPLGDVSHEAVTPRARTSLTLRESPRTAPLVVREIASKLVHHFRHRSSFGSSSSSWNSNASSTCSTDRFRRKRIILIGEDGDERDVLVFDQQLDISCS